MTPILLVVALQSSVAPVTLKAAEKPFPSVYALVYVGKRPKEMSIEDHLRWHIAKFRADATIDAALRDDKVNALKVIKGRKDAVGWLQKNLRVDPLDNTNVFRVSLADGSPAEQAILVNGIVKAFASAENERARKYLTAVLGQVKKEHGDRIQHMKLIESHLVKLNAVKPGNQADGPMIAKQREDGAKALEKVKERANELEVRSAEVQEKIRKPPVLVLEWAERPDPP